MRQIEIVIDPLGRPSIEAIGFKGQNCAEATKGLEAALSAGDGTMSRDYKDSWHETEDTVEQQEQGW